MLLIAILCSYLFPIGSAASNSSLISLMMAFFVDLSSCATATAFPASYVTMVLKAVPCPIPVQDPPEQVDLVNLTSLTPEKPSFFALAFSWRFTLLNRSLDWAALTSPVAISLVWVLTLGSVPSAAAPSF